jgi:hypothetical protein
MEKYDMSHIIENAFSCLQIECIMGQQMYQFGNIHANETDMQLSGYFVSVLCKIKNVN